MNSVQLIGYLGADPEVRYFESGSVVGQFTIYYNERHKGQNGQLKETTHRFHVKAWGPTATFAGEYLRKGSRVAVSGRLSEESWQDRNSGENRSRIVVVATRVDNLTAKNHADQSAQTEEFAEF